MASVSFIPASKLIELVRAADAGAGMYVRVLSSTRLALGKDPMQPTWTIDLSKEHIVPYEPSRPNGAESPIENKVSIRQTSETRATRRSGDYWFELLGQRSDFPSLREMLRAALLGLEEARAGTLDKLSLIKPRSKRIVALEKRLLFSNDAQVDEYAEQLGNGWWFGTNNSAQETNAWLERACSCAGLKWGREFRTSLRESAPKEDAASAFVGTPSTSSPRLDRDITLSEEPAKLYVGDGSWRDDIYYGRFVTQSYLLLHAAFPYCPNSGTRSFWHTKEVRAAVICTRV